MHVPRLPLFASLACWLLLALTLTAAWAVEPKMPKVPKVTLTKVDGTSVNGEMIESSPAGVTVKPTPKADNVLVAWAQIRKTSNGLTHQKVVDEWRVSHPDKLCETCTGEGTVKCDACNGSGVDPAQSKPCDKCKGTGDLGKCPKCTDGKVVCPNTCIKASDFTGGTVGPDGLKRSRVFRNADGSGTWYHEAHVGELLVKEKGVWVDKGKCPLCNGTSMATCPTCHGTAKTECPTCHGGGVVGPPCPTCKAGQVPCKTCDGSGLKPAVAG